MYDLQEFLREKRGTTISKTVIEFDKNAHLASSKIMSGSRPNWGSDYYFSTSASSNFNFVFIFVKIRTVSINLWDECYSAFLRTSGWDRLKMQSQMKIIIKKS